MDKIQQDEQWAQLCSRNKGEKTVDQNGCTESAYVNLTKFIEPYMNSNQISQEKIDKLVSIAFKSKVEGTNLQYLVS